MTIIQNMFAAKNFFRCQPMSVIPNFLPGQMTSKCASFDSMSPLVQRPSSFLQIRSCYRLHGDLIDKLTKNSTPEEKAWVERVFTIANSSHDYHDNVRWHAMELFVENRKLPPMKEEKVVYRKRWATYRLISKIEDIAKRLIDDNVDDKCQVFYLVDQFDKAVAFTKFGGELGIINFKECWQSLLKSSEQPLAQKLRERLSEAGITAETFSQSLRRVYFRLLNEDFDFLFWSVEIVNYGPDDIKGVLNNLPINDTEYECIRILFNLEETKKWQI